MLTNPLTFIFFFARWGAGIAQSRAWHPSWLPRSASALVSELETVRSTQRELRPVGHDFITLGQAWLS